MKNPSEKWMLPLFSLVLACCLRSTTFSQCASIEPRAEFPSEPSRYQWHFSDPAKDAWVYNGIKWKKVTIAFCDSLFRCGQFMVTKERRALSAKSRVYIYDTTGKTLLSNIDTYVVGEGYALAWRRMAIGFLIAANGDTLATFSGCYAGPPEIVDGRLAVSVADLPKELPGTLCWELTTWGMIDEVGHWVIPPKFDAPFHFENGIAEVIYYGQKRKINEKGEFVE